MRGGAIAPDVVRVLIVDDSASVRAVLGRVIESDANMQVMAAVGDAFAAAARMREEAPDVILLDLELPRMDGLTFLRKLMAQRPVPVVVCSGLTEDGSSAAMEALEAGAVSVIAKPRGETARGLQDQAVQLREAVLGAAHARLRGARRSPPPPLRAEVSAARGPEPKLTADVILPPIPQARLAAHLARIPRTEPIMVVGASTGGTEALQVFLADLPADAPGTLIVQHMPEHFTAAFARRLDGTSAMQVREARDGDQLRPGLALIAPGGARHLAVRRSGHDYRVSLIEGPLVSRHRPSVDVLFRSAAQAGGLNVAAAILTGMGDDGARGMKEIRLAGGATFAQDEASCVVYGMPKEAVEHGGVERSAPLNRIAGMMLAEARARALRGRL